MYFIENIVLKDSRVKLPKSNTFYSSYNFNWPCGNAVEVVGWLLCLWHVVLFFFRQFVHSSLLVRNFIIFGGLFKIK